MASYSAAEEQTTIQKYQVGFLLVAVERIAEEPAADRFAVGSVRQTFVAAAFVVAALEEHTHSYWFAFLCCCWRGGGGGGAPEVGP